MRLRHLKTFIDAAETGSFWQAAERLNMTPPAVSLQMKSLEDELATRLFDRTVRPAQLTPQGRAVLASVKEIVGLMDRLIAQTRGHDVSGHIRIGAVFSTMTGILPRALASLQSQYANLSFEVADGFSVQLLKRLENDEIDIALMSHPRTVPDGFEWRLVANEALVVIAPLNCTGTYDEEVLARYPYIQFDRRAWYSQLVDDHLKRRGIEVRRVMEFGTLEAIATMVHFGHGVSIVPQRYLNNPFPTALKCFPFGQPPAMRSIGILSRRDHPKKTLLEAVYSELLLQHGSEARGE